MAGTPVWTRGDTRLTLGAVALAGGAWIVAPLLALSLPAWPVALTDGFRWTPWFEPMAFRLLSIAIGGTTLVQVARHWRSGDQESDRHSITMPTVRVIIAAVAIGIAMGAAQWFHLQLLDGKVARIAAEQSAALDANERPSELTTIKTWNGTPLTAWRREIGRQDFLGLHRRFDAVWVLESDRDTAGWWARQTPSASQEWTEARGRSERGRWFTMTTAWEGVDEATAAAALEQDRP